MSLTNGISMPHPQFSARVQWAITYAVGQRATLTGGASLPSDTGFGANVSLLMAMQQCELVAQPAVAFEPEKVAVPD